MSNVRLFSSDLDGTLLGNPESTLRFKDAWHAIELKARPLLCYNSGRPFADIRSVLKSGELPQPDYVISLLGTDVFDARKKKLIPEFYEHFRQAWDLKKVDKIVSELPGAEKQPSEFLHAYKSSWFLNDLTEEQVEALKQRLADEGIEATVTYSRYRFLDILPARANKDKALQWLCKHLKISLGQVLVAGDTASDAGMFCLPGVRGILVENAQPELHEAVVNHPVYVSNRIMADGVLDGLAHYGVIAKAPSVFLTSDTMPIEVEPSLRMLFEAESFGSLHQKDLDLILTGYQKAIDVLKKNITPLGFSACSLEDNEVRGTDVNYRSVWARDGSITLMYSVDLEDDAIRACQRQTLITLFEHMSPAGQIPSNVRIDDGKPDYSGVGGICSIDSGLWAIIAFYHYIWVTQDIDFLDAYAPKLQRAMDWLSAHDSNNDGLLEVPEAGDWTDLFGRSYNVLYDEVLWYRANVSFGRLLEMRGDHQAAKDYFHWSQHIQKEVLANFWPSVSTSQQDKERHNITFADRQFSVGDSHYLLAQLSPFNFNWRCDVFGNLLAFLTNLMDVDRARICFKYMKGVGVNDPWPVANLYPPVQAGDPDWMPYYTVNLLNLPHHYHNGGIWPLIGGLWVRFIHRLGLTEIAVHELVKLAELNKQGIETEWEFNEWAHGKTGRAMGKRYQAWSAASFIRACKELQLSEKNLDSLGQTHE